MRSRFERKLALRGFLHFLRNGEVEKRMGYADGMGVMDYMAITRSGLTNGDIELISGKPSHLQDEGMSSVCVLYLRFLRYADKRDISHTIKSTHTKHDISDSARRENRMSPCLSSRG